ncbi:DUF6311 domain-containing protein [Roseococcus sp. DSY-14]|uniref:DUF6311 domain-containing protein n=1 Tax=Roseococcus sp. DSY-14 TaxID=3369650 RepID=UPI00387ACC17
MPPGRETWWPPLGAALLGAAIILLIWGPGVVPPWRTGWMLSGQVGPDPVQYWLGWAFFRDDAWRWPPGLNPRYGMELSSSVFYADAIPLLAFLFKALWPLAPVDQYWGLWLVACGALQALFAALAVRRLGGGALAQVAAGGLMALSPLLINRLGGHFALGGQWLVLAGLWLWWAPPTRGRPWGWAALAAATALIHSYILPMVLALWLADAWRRRAWLEAPLVPGAALAALWLAGFFVLAEGHGTAGYGQMQMDLLAPLDRGPWGSLLPDIRSAEHPEANSSYLGLGGLVLAGCALLRPWRRGAWPLAAVLGAMLAFAVSHRVMLGGRLLLEVPLPPALLEMAGALRASERYWWPMAYALMLAGAGGLAARLGPRRAGWALLALLGLQAWDLRPAYARIAHFFPPTEARLPLRLGDPEWRRLAAQASAIRLVPAMNQGPLWEEVAVLAATAGRPTDATYLARTDPAAAAALGEAVLARLRAGEPEPGVLHVLRNAAALEAARAGLPGRLRRLDGVWLIAPIPPGPPAPTYGHEERRPPP